MIVAIISALTPIILGIIGLVKLYIHKKDKKNGGTLKEVVHEIKLFCLRLKEEMKEMKEDIKKLKGGKNV